MTVEHGSEKESLRLGEPQKMTGSPVVRIPFVSSSPSRVVGSGYPSLTTKNYLYVSSPDLTATWLFPKFDQIISSKQDLSAPDKKIVGTVFEVISADTNGDGKVTTGDQIVAYLRTQNGESFQPITPPCMSISSISQIEEGQVLVIYQTESKTVAVLVSIADGSKLKETALPL